MRRRRLLHRRLSLSLSLSSFVATKLSLGEFLVVVVVVGRKNGFSLLREKRRAAIPIGRDETAATATTNAGVTL